MITFVLSIQSHPILFPLVSGGTVIQKKNNIHVHSKHSKQNKLNAADTIFLLFFLLSRQLQFNSFTQFDVPNQLGRKNAFEHGREQLHYFLLREEEQWISIDGGEFFFVPNATHNC